MSLEIKTGFMTAAELEELDKKKKAAVGLKVTGSVTTDGPKIDLATAQSKVGTEIKVTPPVPKPDYKPFLANDLSSFMSRQQPDQKTLTAQGDSGVGAFMDARKLKQTNVLQQTIDIASMNKPDREAEILRVSKEFGIAPSIVRTNLAELQRKSTLMQIDFETLQADNPILSEQLKNISFAAVAHDDLESLGALETAFKYFKEGVLEAPENASSGWKAGTAIYDLGTLGTQIRNSGGEITPDLQLQIDALNKILEEGQGSGMVNSASQIAATMYPMLVGEATEASAFALGVAGTTFITAEMATGPLMFTPDPSDPLIVAGAAATGMAAFGPKMWTGMAEEAFTIEGGISYIDLIEIGATHENASNISVAVGGVNAALEMVGVSVVTKPFRKKWTQFIGQKVTKQMTRGGFYKDVLAAYLLTIGVESTTEAMQEFVNIMGEDFAKWQDEGIDVESLLDTPEGRELAWERMTEVFKTTAQGMALLSLPGTVITYNNGKNQVTQAKQSEQLFAALSDSSENSNLVERLPEKAQDFVKALTAEGDVKNVYIDHQKLNDVLNQRGIDPNSEEAKTFFQDLGIEDQLAEAAVTGGDIVIPIEKYYTNISGTDIHPSLAPHIRVNQNHWSSNESENWIKNNPDFQANFDAIEAEANRVTALSDVEREKNTVYNEVFSQLINQGTSREDATAQSILYSAAFEVLGKEGNVDMAELFEGYNLKIKRIFDKNNKVVPQAELIDLVDEVKAAKKVEIEDKAYEKVVDITSRKQIDIGTQINWDGQNWTVGTIIEGKDANAIKIALVKQGGSLAKQKDVMWTNLDSLTNDNTGVYTNEFSGEQVTNGPTFKTRGVVGWLRDTKAKKEQVNKNEQAKEANVFVEKIKELKKAKQKAKLDASDIENDEEAENFYEANGKPAEIALIEAEIEYDRLLLSRNPDNESVLKSINKKLEKLAELKNEEFVAETAPEIKTSDEVIRVSTLSTLKKAELVKIATDRNIPIEASATKASLIDRINAQQTGQDQAPVEPTKPIVAKKLPTITYLITKGGLKPDSDLVADLISQDIKIPGLYREATTAAGASNQAYDNIPVEEFRDATGLNPTEENGYVSVDWLFERIVDEQAGNAGLADEDQVTMDAYEKDLAIYEEELIDFEKTTSDINTELEDAKKEDMDSMKYDMAEMTDFLENTLGIDTANMDDIEIEKIIKENVYDEQGRVLDQAAFHGTGLAEVFEKFSTDFIGTGEGAIAYGWGLYFASRESIAKWYQEENSEYDFVVNGKLINIDHKDWDLFADVEWNQGENLNTSLNDKAEQLADLNAEKTMLLKVLDNALETLPENWEWINFPRYNEWTLNEGRVIKARGTTKEDALDNFEDYIEKTLDPRITTIDKQVKRLEAYEGSEVELKRTGKIYEVDLAPAEEDYLVWDLDVDKQSDKVSKVIKKLKKEINLGATGGLFHGADVYKLMGYYNQGLGGKEEVSKKLLEMGVRGIKFRDAKSREFDNKSPTFNYVIFDEKDVTITKSFNQGEELTIEELIDKKQGKPANAINLAPNGKISNLSPEQYLEVRTTKFKDWFGDWENNAENASKVLDENGEPSVIFHGTTKDFFEFDKTKASKRGHVGAGYYFTTSEDDAYTNYVGGGPDLSNRIDRTAEQIEALEGSAEVEAFAKEHPEVTASEIYDALKQDSRFELDNQVIALAQKIHNEGYNKIINAYLNIKNPFEIDERRFIQQTWDEKYYKDAARDEVDRSEFTEEGFFDEEAYDDAIEEKAVDIFNEDYNPEVTGNWGAIADGLIRAGHEFDINGQLIVSNTIMEFDLFNDGMVSTQVLMNHLRKIVEQETEYESEYLRKALEYAGYDGIDMDAYYEGKKRWGMPDIEPGTRHYIAFDENQPKSATLNNGEFSIINDNIYQQNKRGSIQFRNVGKRNQSTIISLFDSADNSTFLHETGHFFLQVMQDVAESAEASEAIKADWVKVLKYLGVKSGADIGTKEHELWAESFEQYLFNGKAPTIEMQGPFRKFKEWLKNIYTQATGLGIDITPEISEVFDRLLGTKEEIRLAQQQETVLAQFETPDVLNIDETTWQKYQASVEAARQEAEDDLDHKKLLEVTRQGKQDYKDKLEAMKIEVTKEAEAMPVYKAMHFLRTGEDITSKEPLDGMPHIQFDTKSLKDTFGPKILGQLPRGPKMHTSEGGVHHEIIAETFGFKSGLDMITQLKSTQNIKKFIQSESELRVARDTGALSQDEKQLLIEAGKSAASSKARSKLLQLESDLLTRKAGTVGTPPNVLREMARRLIANKKISNITVKKFRAAEVKAYLATQKAMAKEDWAEAAKQKVTQTLNYFIYREAELATEKMNVMLRDFDRIAKPAHAKKLAKNDEKALDSIAAIYELMAKVDLRRSVGTQKQAYAKIVKQHELEGIAVPNSEEMKALLANTETTNYRDMTYGEFVTLYDSVKSIESIARYKQKIISENEKIAYVELVDELVGTALTEHGEWQQDVADFTDSKMKGFLEFKGNVLATHDKMEFVFEMMDGDEVNGIWWNTFFNRMSDAENAEAIMNEEYITKLTKILESRYTQSERRLWQKVVSTRKGKFNKENIISMALNWGNAGNQTAVLNGFKGKESEFGITDVDVEQMLDRHMEARDWEMVQEVWDLINNLWPEISAMQKRLTGLAPPKVEAKAFKTRFGEMRGGYYPLYYSREFSLKARGAYESSLGDELYAQPSWAAAATQKGHTEARLLHKNELVRMDLKVLSEHMSNVIHDLTHREAIYDINRLINDKRISAAISGVAGKAVYSKIKPWIQRIANPKPPAHHWIDNIVNYANTSATMVAMGFKVTTALVQFFGYTQTVDYLGKRWAWQGLQSFYTHPGEAKEAIFARSVMMRNRTKTLDRDVREAISNITGKDSKFKEIKSKYFYFIGMMDMFVSLPTWQGAYEKSIHNGMSEKEAIAQGDSAVRMTQSSGSIKDMADIQGREDTLYKTFTKFYSYFSAYWNMSMRNRRLVAKGKRTKLEGMESFFWLTILPATLAEALLGRGPNRDDDDENDNPAGWAYWSAINAALFRFSGLVGFRDVINAARHPEWGVQSPWQDLFEASVKMPGNIEDILTGDDTVNDWKGLLLGISYIAQLPGRQIVNMFEHIGEIVEDGEDFSLYELMVSVNRND